MRSVPLYLLVRRDSTEDNLRESTAVERPIRNPPAHALAGILTQVTQDLSLYIPNYLQRMLDNRDGQMRSIIHQPGDIILGHLGELLLENAFQPRKNHKAVARPVVIDHPEFNVSSTLLKNRRL